MVRVLLRLAKIGIIFILEALIVEDALFLCIGQGLRLDLLLEVEQGSELSCDRFRQSFELDFLLAARAGHEGEGDPQRGPAVLEEVHDAVCVEYMSAGEAGTRLRTELCRVADVAELVLVYTIEVAYLLSAGCIEAGKAFAFLGNTFACMATRLVCLLTELDFRLVFLFFFLFFLFLNRLLKLNRLLDLGGITTFLHHFLCYLLHHSL